MNYQQTKFLTSAAKLSQLPPDVGYEVAFAGRSNAGKSSALNTLTQQKNLARTSKTPGRTQLINVFEVTEHIRLIDLPGYGYAKVPQTIKERWHRVLGEYFKHRKSLGGLVVVMDIRHPLKEYDEMMIEWALFHQVPCHVLLTKADKLSRNQAQQTLFRVQHAYAPHKSLVSVQTFSALNRQGLETLQLRLEAWEAG